MSKFETMILRLSIFCVAMANFLAMSAQNDAYGEANVTYTNQYFLGGSIMTAGFGVQAAHGKYQGYKNIKFKSLDILKLKHPKEIRLQSTNRSSRRFIYGKSNAFQTVRLGFGKKKLISDKIRKGAMAIGFSYSIGPSLGLLKPIYIEINETGIGASRTERYDPSIHDLLDITGRASFFRGIFETKLKPGAFFKSSILFEFSTEKDGIQQLEVGGSIDAFTERIPILPDVEKDKQLYINLFISYSLGRKYNKL